MCEKAYDFPLPHLNLTMSSQGFEESQPIIETHKLNTHRHRLTHKSKPELHPTNNKNTQTHSQQH